MSKSGRTAAQKIRQFFQVGCVGAVGFSAICIYKGNDKFYSNVLMPTIQKFADGEQAHNLAVWAAQKGIMIPPSDIRGKESLTSKVLESSVFGVHFPNPIGLAAGFDKDGQAMEGLHNVGFGFVEIGSITPKPQPGNPKPRVFRLVEDQAVINRYGFNSSGHDVVHERVADMRKNGKKIVLGINLGKNKVSPVDSIDDYVAGVEIFGDFADYLVINISSPNTAGLRSLQEKSQLNKLVKGVMKARDSLETKPPIIFKIAPDLTDDDKRDIAGVVLENKVDGLIISNTTISRPQTLKSPLKNETGGLSGKPLKEISTKAIADMYRLTNGKVPIIGAGGVGSGQDAFDKICAGASLVQLYSAFVYHGPPLPSKINRELTEILMEQGFSNVKEAIGSSHK